MSADVAGRGGDASDDFEIAEYCGRLACRKPIVQPAGRGRRREYCSETCRRGADRDYKRAKAMVEHFESYLRKTRHEVAAYGRRADIGDVGLTPEEEFRTQALAAVALERARTVIELTEPDPANRALVELAALVAAVSPVVTSLEARASA